MESFELDTVKLRQVQRQRQKDAREAAGGDSSDDEAPRGGQRNRPQQLGDDDDEDEGDEDAATQAHRSRFKSERAKSRGPNSVPNHEGDISSDSDEEMEG